MGAPIRPTGISPQKTENQEITRNVGTWLKQQDAKENFNPDQLCLIDPDFYEKITDDDEYYALMIARKRLAKLAKMNYVVDDTSRLTLDEKELCLQIKSLVSAHLEKLSKKSKESTSNITPKTEFEIFEVIGEKFKRYMRYMLDDGVIHETEIGAEVIGKYCTMFDDCSNCSRDNHEKCSASRMYISMPKSNDGVEAICKCFRLAKESHLSDVKDLDYQTSLGMLFGPKSTEKIKPVQRKIVDDRNEMPLSD